jgi:putative transposase
MTAGLKRYQNTGEFHFVTFSCYERKSYLAHPSARSVFERVLERFRVQFGLYVFGYVVMPEHVHLLLSEPAGVPLARALHAIKLSMSKLSKEHPFWQARYYDFNVFSYRKQIEKLKYIHRNPVKRGLVEKPEDWEWSSFRHYAAGIRGTVEIESFWTAAEREKAEPRLLKNCK